MVKRPLPETLPSMPAAAGDEDDTSGLQPVAAAWHETQAQMHRAFTARDFGRALDLGVRFQEAHPDHASARLFVEECRMLLESQLTRQLAPLDRVLFACAELGTLESSRIDARTAFLLSQVDGHTTLEDLVDLAPMPRADALRIVAAALVGGLIAFA